ncbi:DUF998 domain-containing protein [Pseudonocardia acaciae]|uniref:DUF998 domain-containing protein n=1 Tax=Pseudonocardia acaciae TaxID=551276 RepID=UPI0014704098|nr:DUF998 domain-containing protein [Pseudonocardia acaciae]
MALLIACGIAASLIYLMANVFGAMRWEGYSSANQAVSELSAVDAPSRPLMVVLLLVHSVLALAFGIGTVWLARRNRALRVTGWLLVGVGVIDLVAPVFPMHMRGVEASATDTMHIIVTVANVLPILLAMGFGAAALGKRFRFYSLTTLAVTIVFGALAGMHGDQIIANAPTPWLGVYERINIGAYLLWMAVLAVALLRNKGAHGRNRTSPDAASPRR